MPPHQTILPVAALCALLSAPAAAAQDGVPPFPCLNPPSVHSTVPGDSPITDQNSLNCLAWQQFIALNWASDGIDTPAGPDPAAQFGRPGDTRPTVWETYSDIHQVFLPDGAAPPPFGTLPPVPAACADHDGSGLRTLSRRSKFTVDFDLPGDASEAFPFNGAPNWLADRNGNQVFFEIVLNRAEFDYIVRNRLYNALDAYVGAAAGRHVDLPRGSLGGGVGAMELKAAWLQVPDPGNPRWQRYKLAEVLLADGATCTRATAALVGLHIIHKTESQPQWIWSTFEHVDNAPDQRAVDAGTASGDYTFFDAACTERDLPAQCVGNSVGGCDATVISTPPPARTSCAANAAPTFCLSAACPPLPVQVTRLHAIPNGQDNLVGDANAAAQALIRARAGADSVFANYMLVGVLWSDSPVDENTPNRPPPLAPLSLSGMRPAPTERPVANTTMETYIQNTTCIQCHMGAALPAPGGIPGLAAYASDYSFSFTHAAAPEPIE